MADLLRIPLADGVSLEMPRRAAEASHPCAACGLPVWENVPEIGKGFQGKQVNGQWIHNDCEASHD